MSGMGRGKDIIPITESTCIKKQQDSDSASRSTKNTLGRKLLKCYVYCVVMYMCTLYLQQPSVGNGDNHIITDNTYSMRRPLNNSISIMMLQ